MYCACIKEAVHISKDFYGEKPWCEYYNKPLTAELKDKCLYENKMKLKGVLENV